MSYVDLATLTLHRRHELQTRVKLFDEKCDSAISDIKKLQVKTRNFVSQLDFDPNGLKERFLMFMKKIEEYMYVVTDFNLAVAQIEEIKDTSSMPEQDFNPNRLFNQSRFDPSNLMDTLSEPGPSTTACICTNHHPEVKKKTLLTPKAEQTLIAFSNSSSESTLSRKQSSNNVSNKNMASKEVQCSFNEDCVAKLSLNGKTSTPTPPPRQSSPSIEDSYNLPQQKMLEVDHVYEGTIMTVDGAYFWVITDDLDETKHFLEDMRAYYLEHNTPFTSEQIKKLVCCVYYDEQTGGFYRALFVKMIEDDLVELFVVDTGEIRTAPVDCVLPLVKRFADRPPYARCCQLAGIDLSDCNDDEKMATIESFMSQYIGKLCSIEVDDNSSEALGVYVILPSNETVNALIVQSGLVNAIDKPAPEPAASPVVMRGPPEMASGDLNMDDGPEYEDPVEAVTGYHNRDEADICKHYKGGPEKTCFKGSRCKKLHILKHPDGWTMDRVEVVGKIKPLALPAPGAWLSVIVTNVCHYDRLHVQLITDDKEDHSTREFGVMLPPTTLTALHADMNSPATVLTYKPYKVSPAVGELVAALYPLDGAWYRARVISVTRANQTIEVMYIDYGTILSVREDEIKVLDARFAFLPIQAILCTLAGVQAKTEDSKQWLKVKNALATMTENSVWKAHVISCGYDEITIELLDTELQVNIAEQLAALDLIKLVPYSVTDYTSDTCQQVMP